VSNLDEKKKRADYDARVEALRRLGAKVIELHCGQCGAYFIDPAPLGGRKWQVKMMSNYKRGGRWGEGGARVFCSEACATSGLVQVRGAQAAWVEGFEP
jgi:hypothetical protein